MAATLQTYHVSYQVKEDAGWEYQSAEVRGHSVAHATAVFGALLTAVMDGVDMLAQVRQVKVSKLTPKIDDVPAIDYDAEFKAIMETEFYEMD